MNGYKVPVKTFKIVKYTFNKIDLIESINSVVNFFKKGNKNINITISKNILAKLFSPLNYLLLKKKNLGEEENEHTTNTKLS